MGLSGRVAAKALGLSQPALVKAAKSGRISREPDGSYDLETIRRQLAENTNAAKRRKQPSLTFPQIPTPVIAPITETAKKVQVTPTGESPDNLNGTFQEAQRKREWLRVQKDRLELSRKRSELAPIGEINAWVAGMMIRAREILVRIAPELKDRLAQTVNPHECEKLVAGEIHRALSELSEYRAAAT